MNARSLIFPLLACSVGAYFGYSLQYGDHGLKARANLEARAAALKGELAGLKSVRTKISHDVSLLRPESLDPDMLDERARAILNMARPDEIVMMKRQPPTVKFMPLSER